MRIAGIEPALGLALALDAVATPLEKFTRDEIERILCGDCRADHGVDTNLVAVGVPSSNQVVLGLGEVDNHGSKRQIDVEELCGNL